MTQMDDITHLIAGKPPEWSIAPRWPTLDDAPTLFIAQWSIRRDDPSVPDSFPDTDIYLFGGRRLYPPEKLPAHLRHEPSYTIEFKLVDYSVQTSTISERHLWQHDTIPYCEVDDPGNYQCVDMMSKKDFRYIWRKPRWKPSEASWPCTNSKPMLFVGQVLVRENDVTRQYFTWDTVIFLFVDEIDVGVMRFSIFTQDIGIQTAEDHYKAEELMWLFESNRSDDAVVARCIKEGDRYVHEFILEHNGVTNYALQLLAKNGKNKSIRTAAQRKLADKYA